MIINGNHQGQPLIGKGNGSSTSQGAPTSNKFVSSKQPGGAQQQQQHLILGGAGTIQQFQRLTITGHSNPMMGIAAGHQGSTKLNDLLVESQKMIYAPPSREKSKQTMRSPMLEINAGGASQGNGNVPIAGTVQSFMGNASDEYMMSSQQAMQPGIYSGVQTVGGNPMTANGSKRINKQGGTNANYYGQNQQQQQPIQITKAISNSNSGVRGGLPSGADKYQSILNSHNNNINANNNNIININNN